MGFECVSNTIYIFVHRPSQNLVGCYDEPLLEPNRTEPSVKRRVNEGPLLISGVILKYSVSDTGNGFQRISLPPIDILRLAAILCYQIVI